MDPASSWWLHTTLFELWGVGPVYLVQPSRTTTSTDTQHLLPKLGRQQAAGEAAVSNGAWTVYTSISTSNHAVERAERGKHTKYGESNSHPLSVASRAKPVKFAPFTRQLTQPTNTNALALTLTILELWGGFEGASLGPVTHDTHQNLPTHHTSTGTGCYPPRSSLLPIPQGMQTQISVEQSNSTTAHSSQQSLRAASQQQPSATASSQQQTQT